MKKFILILTIILTFGMVLIPCCFAKNINIQQLDNVNRVSYIDYTYFNNSNYYTFEIYFNKDNLSTSNYYLYLSVFTYDNLNTPINWSSEVQYINIYPSSLSLTWNTYNTTYGGIRNTQLKTGTWWQSTGIGTKLQVRLGTNYTDATANEWIENHCFMVYYGTGSTMYAQSFVPNTYYNTFLNGTLGAFQTSKAYLNIAGNQGYGTDYTSTLLTYNSLYFGTLSNMIYDTNKNNTQYKYYLTITFDNMSIADIPNFTIKYLELQYITINGEYLSYDTAKSRYNWLNRNIYLYNDNATLFTTNDATLSNAGNFITLMQFRIADYDFTQSTYYNSTYGLSNYIKNATITTLGGDSQQAYNNGYNAGYNTGYDTGLTEGFNRGVASDTGGFDALMFSIADVPVRIISSILNFEILGFNLMAFFMAIITLLLFIRLMRKFKE